MPAVALSALLLEIAASLAEEPLSAGGFGVDELEIELPALAGFVRGGLTGCGGIILRTPDPFAQAGTRFSRLRATLSFAPEP
ncbi:MAG TPA: hypothetical protein VGS22_01680 [Thermoanaerobaculia bacterium]|jgi:hypothetical protein|nr:hypothetical protein [Thermoanaerobaculia bacterium]